MRAVVFNLGCKVNQYESDCLGQELVALDYEVSFDLVPADIYILNTCAVTAEAERKSRQAVTRCRALNADAKIFVCGCASERFADAFKKDNVIYVSGTSSKSKIIKHLEDSRFSKNISELPLIYEDATLTHSDRARAYVKIQDGCNNFCSYCIIPYLRGRSRSRDIDKIVKEVELLSKSTQEIVLTGINVMSYGVDLGYNLAELIRRLKDFEVRIRLSSFYAEGITEELLDALFSLKRFCPHFHLSLQSGDDGVLKAMNRHYTTADYSKKIDLIRAYDPNSFIATDIITGYPTEDKEAHNNTIEFIKKENFSDLHIFPYSKRDGTRAAKLPLLPSEVVKERKNELLLLKNDLKNSYLQRNIGTKQSVLIEETDGEYSIGHSQYYIKIYTKRTGTIVECTPDSLYKDGLKEE